MSSTTVIALVIAALSFTAGPALAQQPPKEAPPAPVVGEVLAVDDKARTFSIKTATEGEVKFSYTEQTVIEGADKGAQGLIATGSEVTVTYDSHGTARVATRIEVKPKK
jgi:hypothetical protein